MTNNLEIKKTILNKIKEYDRILLFRHFRPDGDAVGSTKGLAAIIKAPWPEKEVLHIALGNQVVYYVTPDAVCQESIR